MKADPDPLTDLGFQKPTWGGDPGGDDGAGSALSADSSMLGGGWEALPFHRFPVLSPNII